MSQAVALVAEPDRALRDLVKRALAASGYRVFESESVLELEGSLRFHPLIVAPSLLFMISTRIAVPAALSLRAAARARSRAGLSTIGLVLTYEFGTRSEHPAIDLAPCEVAGELEKPFDFQELQAIGLRYAQAAPFDPARG